MSYYVKALSRRTWYVVDEHGHPIYDDNRYGNDKPVIFHDLDKAEACAERLNVFESDEMERP